MLVTLADQPYEPYSDVEEAEEAATIAKLDAQADFESLAASIPPAEEPPVPYRVAEVMATYRFELAATTASAELFVCQHPSDPRRRYVLCHKFSDDRLPARWSCSCPAFAKNQNSCKHLFALGSIAPEKIAGWNERKTA